MSELERFSPELQEFLAGLFYRVGDFISASDDTDVGEESEELEQKSMLALITQFSESRKLPPLICDMARETLARRRDWVRWGDARGQFLSEFEDALDLLQDSLIEDEAQSLRRCAFFLAMRVAESFREEADYGLDDANYFDKMQKKIAYWTLALTDRDARKKLNISPAEDSALHQLYDILNRLCPSLPKT